MPKQAYNYPAELQNKVTQLDALLAICYGVGADAFDSIGREHRDSLVWLASDLAGDIDRIVNRGGSHD